MPRAQSRKLNSEQFEFIRPILITRYYTAEHIEAARLCLVEGATMQSVATKCGFNTRQGVADTIRRVWAVWLLSAPYFSRDAASAMEGVQLIPVPDKLVQTVRDLIEADVKRPAKPATKK